MIKLILILLLFFLFFSYALVSMQFLFPIIAAGVIIIFFIKRFNKSIQISGEDKIWLLCLIVNVIGLIRTPNIKEAIVFLGFILVFILLKISLSNLENWKVTFLSGVLTFSAIHVFSTILQYFNPEIVRRINQLILPSAAYNINRYQVSVGRYAGITGQVGANAFYITIFLAVIFCFLIEYRKKYVTGPLFIMGCVALILTTKRGLLLFNITAFIAILLIVKIGKMKNNNKVVVFLLTTLMIGLIAIIGVSLLGNAPMLNQLLVDDDITSGRMGIYSSTFQLVKSAPLIGRGLSSVEYQVGIKAHNIYLQLWAELGLLGLLIYSLAMIITLSNSIKLYIGVKNEQNLNCRYFILISIYIQIVFMLYGLTGNVLYDYFIVGIYMLSISLPGTIRYSLKKTRGTYS